MVESRLIASYFLIKGNFRKTDDTAEEELSKRKRGKMEDKKGERKSVRGVRSEVLANGKLEEDPLLW